MQTRLELVEIRWKIRSATMGDELGILGHFFVILIPFLAVFALIVVILLFLILDFFLIFFFFSRLLGNNSTHFQILLWKHPFFTYRTPEKRLFGNFYFYKYVYFKMMFLRLRFNPRINTLHDKWKCRTACKIATYISWISPSTIFHM